MRDIAINSRLLSAANYVRAGAVFADIGTDHGYLPIFLLKKCKIVKAFCADINEGPLSKARANFEKNGLLDNAEFYRTDGVKGLSQKGITDYAMCGMGGELISGIINDSKHIRKSGVRLIVQPQSKPGFVRRTLRECGFLINSESYSHVGHKYYVCICADYAGKKDENAVYNLNSSEKENKNKLFLLEKKEKAQEELSLKDAVIDEIGEEKHIIGDKESIIGYLKMRRTSYSKKRKGEIIRGRDTYLYDEVISKIDVRISKAENGIYNQPIK